MSDQPMTDLQRAYEALTLKAAAYKRYFDYYDGDQPLAYTSEKLKDLFAGLTANFSENWCSVVVDACKDRINLKGLEAEDESAAATLEEFWDRNELELESDSVHEAALVAGESFVIVWPDEETQRASAFYNDPRLVHVFYKSDNPRAKWFAAKWWEQEDKSYRLNLYYPERIEYYVSQNRSMPTNANGFVPFQPTEANPYGIVPVFPFSVQRRLVKSDIKSAIPLQDAINKLFADMMVAAEYGAFPARYAITNGVIQGKLKSEPGSMFLFPAGEGQGQGTSVGQFQSADLANYIAAMENLAGVMSAITSTPKHLFFESAGQVSGEALLALEAPLNRKAQDRIDRFAPVWQEIAAFALRIDAGVDIPATDITAAFDVPETVQPRTQAEIIQLLTAAGIPLAAALRLQGMPQAEIDQIIKERNVEAAQRQREAAMQAQQAQGREAALAQAEAKGQPIADRVVRKVVDSAVGQARKIVGG